MSVTASLVKELRERTNAGMLDCKKALEETKGDFDAAVEWLRKKGLSSAAKKAGRVAAEGAVYATVEGNTGVLIEVNSETDFVARNDGFKNFVQDMATQLIKTNATGDMLEQAHHKQAGKKVSDVLKEVIATIGENIVIRRSEKYTVTGTNLVHSYVHGEGKIGVLVELETPNKNDQAKTLAQDLCLHIAAMNPMAISADQMPADVVNKEKEILKAKNLEQGKKPEMVDKIVEGQIRKFLAENCLLEQAFVKNPDQKVNDLVAATGKALGGTVKLKKFVRYELGQGIEKKQTDFAAEVAAQVKGH